MAIFLFLILLISLILVHEFGHFFAAKKSGIRVDDFGIGFPPKLWSVKKGETEYSLNAIPLGGFVKIFGENGETNDIGDASKNFSQKPKYIQGIVLLAGIAMNILFAWPLLSIAFFIGVPVSLSDSPSLPNAEIRNAALTITEVLLDSPAENAGLRAGDKILAVSMSESENLGGKKDALVSPSPEAFQEFVKTHSGNLITEIQRGTEIFSVSLIPQKGVLNSDRERGGEKSEKEEASETPAIGVALDTIGIAKFSFLGALTEGASRTVLLTKETAVGLAGFFADIFRGRADFSQVSGPVGIVHFAGEAGAIGLSSLLILAALISINLGLVNLLPIPALDGGRFFFLLIEAIRGSPINPKIANSAHGIGFLLLILLILIATYHDIVKLVS